MIRPVVDQYPPEFRDSRSYLISISSGFSGALIWKIWNSLGAFCLRRWPAKHPTAERLRYMHAVMEHAKAKGFHLSPTPIRASSGASFVEHDGRFWEITTWAKGETDDSPTPSEARMCAACRTLATFHLAVEDFPSPIPRVGPSPNIAERLAISRSWKRLRLSRLAKKIADDRSDFADPAERILFAFEKVRDGVERDLENSRERTTRLQPCLRDIWRENVIFQGDEVTGLIDFGAVRYDSVATDVARLLMSLASEDSPRWSLGLAAYEAIRPLDSVERSLLPVFSRSLAALAGMTWLVRVYEEERSFDYRTRGLERMRESLEGLGESHSPRITFFE